ncbi:MAG: Flp pilus assembly protein CpaB [Gemmatimonadota bacterium]|nr:Flp pilus assembly protein CpaB [Gemmatimonadota bacterium]
MRKKRRRKWIALVLALVSGGAAGYLAFQHLERPLSPQRAEAALETSRVVVAAHDLELGTVLKPSDVRLVEWPAKSVPPGFATRVEDVVGRGVIQPVAINEPLIRSKIAKKEEGGGLPIVIPEGMRAVSVKVDEVIGVAGFVLPGTRVDVLVTLNSSASREEPATRVILQNVRAIASNQTIQRDPNGDPQSATVITLLVTPEQAEKLTLAATEGRIHLALRNTLDTEQVETAGAKARSLVGESQRPTPQRTVRRGPVRQQTSVITYNGSERSVTTF